jgi:predicted branched-subunit amino acid permease
MPQICVVYIQKFPTEPTEKELVMDISKLALHLLWGLLTITATLGTFVAERFPIGFGIVLIVVFLIFTCDPLILQRLRRRWLGW